MELHGIKLNMQHLAAHSLGALGSLLAIIGQEQQASDLLQARRLCAHVALNDSFEFACCSHGGLQRALKACACQPTDKGAPHGDDAVQYANALCLVWFSLKPDAHRETLEWLWYAIEYAVKYANANRQPRTDKQ